jgi:hypothetical protein
MQPESDTGIGAGSDKPAGSERRKGGARARAGRTAGGRPEQPVARVMQLVAAMKAEQDVAPASGNGGERVRLMGWLRRILDTRAQERRAWEQQVAALEARFAAAEAAAQTALSAVEQADAQHQRLVADLKLMHEHQRSIWALERRQLEITIDGLMRERRNRLLARAARLARPAVAAGLLLASLAALALSGDAASVVRHTLLDRNTAAPAAVIVLK